MGSFVKGQRCNPAKMNRAKVMLPEQGDGCYLWVRALSAKEIHDHMEVHPDTPAEEQMTDANGVLHRKVPGNLLIGLCAQNDDGTPVFTDAAGEHLNAKELAADVTAGLDVGADKIMAIIERINDLSGVGKDRKGK